MTLAVATLMLRTPPTQAEHIQTSSSRFHKSNSKPTRLMSPHRPLPLSKVGWDPPTRKKKSHNTKKKKIEV